MRLIKNPNEWSCSIASLSMLIGDEMELIIKSLGHDGSQLMPNTKGDLVRKGFSVQELTDYCLRRHTHAIVTIDPYGSTADGWDVFNEQQAEDRLNFYLKRYNCLLAGQRSLDQWHCVAWNSIEQKIYDPMIPEIYDLDSGIFTVSYLFPIIRLR